MTITEFLLARIAEDEVTASPGAGDIADLGQGEGGRYGYVPPGKVNPRALAECEAKRRIVEREESEMRAQWRRRSDEHRQTWEQLAVQQGARRDAHAPRPRLGVRRPP